jgi:hypothetical protein
MQTTTEQAAEIARRLINIYVEHKLPRAAEMNRKYPEGFTPEKLRDDANALYRMIILAAYDRQPFTRIARGWEPIWGVVDSGPSLPALLRAKELYSLNVLSLTPEQISERLAECRFFGYKLDTDGANTRYCKTLKDGASLVNERNLKSTILSARSAEDVQKLHRFFDGVHGIGPTIASKLVMYTLREIGMGSISPRELYPAVRPILAEYHNARLSEELKAKYGQPIIDQVFEALVKLCDPFAIDALYYIDRDEPDLKNWLLA